MAAPPLAVGDRVRFVAPSSSYRGRYGHVVNLFLGTPAGDTADVRLTGKKLRDRGDVVNAPVSALQRLPTGALAIVEAERPGT